MDYFFSNGKLLLTAEYFILDGALGLAVPTQKGQELWVEEVEDKKKKIYWQSFIQNKPWVEVEIDYENWKIKNFNIYENANFILKVLKIIQNLSYEKLQENHSYHIKTNLEFPSNFGWGSSSTLIHNLAQWAKIDPFLLNEKTLGGSGYDIAIAQEKRSILYKKTFHERKITPVNFSPEFKNDLIFIHLNQKQNSRDGIKTYQSKNKNKDLIENISEITKNALNSKNIEDFSKLMKIHENEVSKFLEIEKVKQKFFPSCPVFVKSLGAWGGDFVMSRKFDGYENFFHFSGFHTFFDWNEIIS